MDINSVFMLIETYPISCVLASVVVLLLTGVFLSCFRRQYVDPKKSKVREKKRAAKEEKSKSSKPISSHNLSQQTSSFIPSEKHTSSNTDYKSSFYGPSKLKFHSDFAENGLNVEPISQINSQNAFNPSDKKSRKASHKSATLNGKDNKGPHAGELIMPKLYLHEDPSHSNEQGSDSSSEWQEVNYSRRRNKSKRV